MAKSSKRIKSASITRFAHPFFTLVKPADRKAVNGAKRLTDHIETQLEKIPSVKGDSVMRLDDTIFARTRGKVSTSQNLGDALTMGPIAAVIAGAMFFCQLSPEDITILHDVKNNYALKALGIFDTTLWDWRLILRFGLFPTVALFGPLLVFIVLGVRRK